METLEVLRAEHATILQVLDQLEQAADAAEGGIPMPADIFQDIEQFLSIFVEQCHHGKEEGEIFPRLKREHIVMVKRLEDEHATGRQLATALTRAITMYHPGNTATGASLAAAARAYSTFLSRHIDQETEELFPVVEKELESEDQAIVAAFERLEVEQIGSGTHDRLHALVDRLGKRIVNA
jgi:hemerythrin-like domain-containing protein